MNLPRLIAIARGQEPADLVLRRARIVNTLVGEIEEGDVAIGEGRVAGIGDYSGREEIDLGGRYLLPGFIDGHTHLESSMLSVGQYARAVVPRGTTAIVTDLHEIANVAGLSGARALMAEARRVPLDLFLMVPSCVPATHLETAGATVGPEEVRRALRWRGVLGLGEMMNFPGVLFGDSQVLAKLEATVGRVRDGHSPGLSGRDLNAYLTAGLASDHECTRLAEAQEKLRRGMFLMIREGSSEKNLAELLPLVTDQTWPRCLLVVDDRSAHDLLVDGDMDAVVRKAVSLGLDPIRAIQLATINPARYFRLEGYGAVAPGYLAHLIVTDDLGELRAQMVFHSGRLVAREGQALFAAPRPRHSALTQTVNVRSFAPEALRIEASRWHHPVIEVIPGQIVTRKVEAEAKVENGQVVADPGRDLLKAVVVERHHATGNIGLGLVRGFGLRQGALASSVAHDSHNIVAVGASDQDLYLAIQETIAHQGGLALAEGGEVIGSLPLPIGGLLSPEPLEAVAARLEALERQAAELGCALPAPFATLSFLALPVIPEIRLTDKGLVDVVAFKILE